MIHCHPSPSSVSNAVCVVVQDDEYRIPAMIHCECYEYHGFPMRRIKVNARTHLDPCCIPIGSRELYSYWLNHPMYIPIGPQEPCCILIGPVIPCCIPIGPREACCILIGSVIPCCIPIGPSVPRHSAIGRSCRRRCRRPRVTATRATIPKRRMCVFVCMCVRMCVYVRVCVFVCISVCI